MTRRVVHVVVVTLLCCLAALSLATVSGGANGPRILSTPALRAAALIAGRPVTIRCESNAREKRAYSELGHVSEGAYDTRTRRFVTSATTIVLASRACLNLVRYSKATVKPTTCGSRGGPCFLAREAAPNDAAAICMRSEAVHSCFATAAHESLAYWHAYEGYATALEALAHEAVHVRQKTRGQPLPPDSLVESQAECSALQWVSTFARIFGATSADARSIASYLWLVSYPAMRVPHSAYERKRPYWSRDCRPGGALDIRGGRVSKASWPNGPRPRGA